MISDGERSRRSAAARARYEDPAERLKTSRAVAQAWADLDPAARDEWIQSIRAARRRRRART